jgi:hypothetical protein
MPDPEQDPGSREPQAQIEPESQHVPASAPTPPDLSAEESTPMIDIHDAHHAASTWKEFFIHIATIVLGLLIAVGLEHAVEYFHHRQEISETRDALRAERETNRKAFAYDTAAFRNEVQMMKNNLLVLTFLKQHPGTPEEKLPGTLAWGGTTGRVVYVAWDAAQQSNMTQSMSRKEIADTSKLYRSLLEAQNANDEYWREENVAKHYSYADPNPSDLSAAEVEKEIDLTESCLDKLYRFGIAQENIGNNDPDFSPAPTYEELNLTFVGQRSSQDIARLSPAHALTTSRLAQSRAALAAQRKANDAK